MFRRCSYRLDGWLRLQRLDLRPSVRRFKNQFLALLEENPHVTPGKPLTDVSIQFLGRECYSSLPERDRQEIYDEFQKSLKVIAIAYRNF